MQINKNNITTTTIKLEGMSCANCANTIETKLNSLDGLMEASVNLSTEKVLIKFNMDQLGIREILDAIKNSGHSGYIESKESDYKRIQAKIEGMSCSSCAINIEKAVGQMKGVLGINVNL